ncbi:hypothetical protein D9M71_754680 [compost metagenome]
MVAGVDRHRNGIARAVHVLGTHAGGKADTLGDLGGGLGQYTPLQVGFSVGLGDVADEAGQAAH